MDCDRSSHRLLANLHRLMRQTSPEEGSPWGRSTRRKKCAGRRKVPSARMSGGGDGTGDPKDRPRRKAADFSME